MHKHRKHSNYMVYKCVCGCECVLVCVRLFVDYHNRIVCVPRPIVVVNVSVHRNVTEKCKNE